MSLRHLRRPIAVLLITLLLGEIIVPTAAYALTGGPSQPEFESFEPISTDQMVDPFTGDFNYNIPLLTVPGPNGGYPLNLAYHAGIGMEQEASWVGLGWNVNVGEINRTMRGVPDDFNGDAIHKEQNMKPNTTVALTASAAITELEVLGAQASMGFGYTLNFNTYRGIGYRHFTNLSATTGDANGSAKHLGGLRTQVSIIQDSQNGVDIPISLSYSNSLRNASVSGSASTNWNSRQGWNALEMRAGGSGSVFLRSPTGAKNFGIGLGLPTGSVGVDFARSTYVPAPFAPTSHMEIRAGFEFGGGNFPMYTPSMINISGSYSKQKIEDPDRSVKAFGALYAENGNSSDHINDLNRENDVPVTKYIPNIPIPIFAYDPYTINGQGTGGAFHVFRSDVGILHEERMSSEFRSTGVEAELGTPAQGSTWKLGVDIAKVHSVNYSGMWQGGHGAITGNTNDLRFHAKHADGDQDHLYEPAYFKSVSEMVSNPTDRWAHIGNEAAVRFPLGEQNENGFRGASFVKNQLESDATSYEILRDRHNERDARAQHIAYATNRQLYLHPDHLTAPKHLATISDNENYDDELVSIDRSNEALYHHVGEITVTSPDGTRHVYGLPAMVNNHVETTLAITNHFGDSYDNPSRYIPEEHVTSPENGTRDESISRTQIPPYSHAHLLTAVYSPDYVDLEGDGPTEDDLGYYTKFNYTVGTQYHWRTPYTGYYYHKGYYSDPRDDKASCAHGRKTIHYLRSVETKTHKAIFILNEGARPDAYGAEYEGDGTDNAPVSGPQASRYLSEIRLISKSDPTEVLKTVVFTYAHETDEDELCVGAESAPGHGKLTLTRVHFKHMNSERGALSPYSFSYGEGEQNPSYGFMSVDRWGNFQEPISTGGFTANEHPYVIQDNDDPSDEERRNERASAWCLRRIGLPSGGEIIIDYESDDYGYVQNEPAAQMFQIVGTENDQSENVFDFDQISSRARLKSNDLKIKFRLPAAAGALTASQGTAYVNKLLGNKREVYFKLWMDLKDRKDEPLKRALEYVEGYAKIDRGETPGIGTDDDGVYGYFYVEQEEYSFLDLHVHPFRKAAWQYLRLKRPDLFQTINIGNGTSLMGSLMGLLNWYYNPLNEMSYWNVVTGYYGMCNIKGFGKYIQLADEGERVGKPSFIRLIDAVDGTKYGGGHRVASIKINDNWSDDGGRSYGKTYEYTLSEKRDVDFDGIDEQDPYPSSGVASYEPMIGGEENALHKPVWFDGSDGVLSYKSERTFLETPFNESYYPTPVVGYSRVVVRDLVPSGIDVGHTGSGITVHEFYTAKDFPVITDQTNIADTHHAQWIPIPLVGQEEYNNNGYSQGYSVVLNDMHGKPRSIAIHKQNADLNGQPVTRTSYVYHTDAEGRLNNLVDVVVGNWQHETAYLGQTIEFVTDMDEHSSNTHTKTRSINLQSLSQSPWPFIPSYFPGHETSQAMYRAVATNKVINKHGILKKVITENEGSRVEQENILFDGTSGEPLMTSTTNSFGKPVFTYTYAAHNNYDGMGAAYRNWGAEFPDVTITNGVALIDDAERYFVPGDEVELWNASNNGYSQIWVTDVSASTGEVTFENENASLPNVSHRRIRISRSGRRNQLTTRHGTLVSLRNATSVDLFAAINDHLQGTTVSDLQTDPHNTFEYWDCGSQALYNVWIKFDESGLELKVTQINEVFQENWTCHSYLTTENSAWLSTYAGQNMTLTTPPEGLNGTGEGQPVDVFFGDDRVVFNWIDEQGCFGSCKAVLHADATTYKDGWDYNYTDAGTPSPSGNDYRYGRKGIWRPWTEYLFQVDRLKGEGTRTNIASDGEYTSFVRFFFNPSLENDARWYPRNEFKRYSPYGFPLEASDAVGIHSSNLYGYANSLVVASGTNAEYGEIAFEGFEDHGSSLSGYESGHGHLSVAVSDDPPSFASDAHTGRRSVAVHSGSHLEVTAEVGATMGTGWTPKPGERYTVSAWVKKVADVGTPAISLLNRSTTEYIAPISTESASGARIEGWQRLSATFQMPASVGTDLQIRIGMTGTNVGFRVDDLRIHPADGSLTTHVYDPYRLWLIATLDDRNYATLYQYDEEGVLTQVKKETERGIRTLRTTRQNTKREL